MTKAKTDQSVLMKQVEKGNIEGILILQVDHSFTIGDSVLIADG